MRSKERRKTVGGKIQNYTPPPLSIQDNLVAIDVSTESSVSPFNIFRSSGSYSFQIKSNLGQNITVTGVTVPSGDSVVTSFPLVINSTPATLDFTGSNSGDHVIHHNGLNSPFTVNVTISAPSAQ